MRLSTKQMSHSCKTISAIEKEHNFSVVKSWVRSNITIIVKVYYLLAKYIVSKQRKCNWSAKKSPAKMSHHLKVRETVTFLPETDLQTMIVIGDWNKPESRIPCVAFLLLFHVMHKSNKEICGCLHLNVYLHRSSIVLVGESRSPMKSMEISYSLLFDNLSSSSSSDLQANLVSSSEGTIS